MLLAESADRGLKMLTTERPDLVLSDVGMPAKDGYEFIRELRVYRRSRELERPPSRSRRSPDRKIAFEALMAGYQVHLAKPVKAQELIATVASLVGRT